MQEKTNNFNFLSLTNIENLLKNDPKKLNDRQMVFFIKNTENEILKNKTINLLFEKYRNLIFRKWKALNLTLNKKINLPNYIKYRLNDESLRNKKDEYFSESFLTFLKCLNAIKLEKIKDDKWLFLNYFMRYLDAQNKKIINDLLKKAKKERSLTKKIRFKENNEEKEIERQLDHTSYLNYLIQSVEEIYENNFEKNYFDFIEKECFKKWDNIKKDIWNLKKQNNLIINILKETNLNYYYYKKYFNEMCKDFKELYEYYQNKKINEKIIPVIENKFNNDSIIDIMFH